MEGNELIDYHGKKHRYTFFTFRASPNEPQVFEDYVTLILPIIRNSSQYSYSIEMDDTTSRHIHVFASLKPTEKDKSKIDQRFCDFKEMKLFRKSLQFKDTNWETAFHYGKKYNANDDCSKAIIPKGESDHMKALGYTMKDINKRYQINGIKITEITRAMQFYAATARIKDSCIQNSWKIVNNKNFHILLEDYAKKNNMTVHDWDLIPKMTHDRHTFQISARDLKKYECELRFANSEYDEKSEHLDTILNFREGDEAIAVWKKNNKEDILEIQETYINQIKKLKEENQKLKDLLRHRAITSDT